MACINRDAMMQIRANWKARGLCTRCGGEKPCESCRVKRGQYKNAHPEKNAARSVTQRAVRAGTLPQPDCCEGCHGDSIPLEKHHLDYSRPLLVLWLCKPCHALADKIRRMYEDDVCAPGEQYIVALSEKSC